MERMNLAVKTAAAMLVVLLAVALINGCNEDNAPVTSPGVTQTTPDIDFNNPPKDARRGILPRSKTLADCPTDRYCGPMDVVFVIDITGSMGGAIDNVKLELSGILDCIDLVSGGDYQMGLVTFNDDVLVIQNLAPYNKAAVGTSINALSASGGAGEPEASDEAINTVVNELPARANQTGSFSGWRTGAKKVVILVTDAHPGGFDDTYTAGVDDVNAAEYAQEAALAGIAISAVFTETWDVFTSEIAPIMNYYATATGGIYEFIPWTSYGVGTGTAILGVITTCGYAEIPISIDIHAGGCPNPINRTSSGVTPVAILGGSDFDVSDIDFSTIKLNGVSPQLWSAYEDVGTPYLGELLDCYSCNATGPDGTTDLKLKFNTSDLGGTLSGYDVGDCVVVELTGKLTDGRPFRGKDIVKIVK